MNYCVVLKYSQDDKCYIISVPDLPGCMADGESPNEAYENAKIVTLALIETEENDEEEKEKEVNEES